MHPPKKKFDSKFQRFVIMGVSCAVLYFAVNFLL